jgi:hypothetical protein
MGCASNALPFLLCVCGFRFAQMQGAVAETPYHSNAASLKPAAVVNNVIDKGSYFGASLQQNNEGLDDSLAEEGDHMSSSNWSPMQLRPVPAFYPLEKSSRLVEDESPVDIANRLAECLRTLSVQAVYDSQAGTASLLTAENVEMHLSLWKTTPANHSQGVVVELQRRKGDSIAFHRYSRSILDAAVGDVDVS